MNNFCQRINCGRPATHALQLGIGGLMDPDEAPPRVKMLLGVIVCEDCMEGETPDRWFGANPALVQLAAISMGQDTRPDPDRAVILGVPIDSDEYRQLQLQGLLQKKAN